MGFTYTDIFEKHDEVTQEVMSEIFEEEEEVQDIVDELNVRDQAIRQMEHANLYRVLLEGNIFAPNSARPEVQDQVEAEIKQFIESRMCELLNIGAPVKKQSNIHPELENLSDKEVMALKMLLTKMASKLPDTVPTKAAMPVAKLNPVEPAKVQVPSASLNPSVQANTAHRPALANSVQKPTPRPTQKKKVQKSKPQPTKVVDPERQELLKAQAKVNQGTQVKSKKYKARMPSVAEQMAKIEQDKAAMSSGPINEEEASAEIDADQLSRFLGYKQQ